MNTAIIMDMMFNTEMIVKDMKGGKEDMTEKRLTGGSARCGKTIGQYICPECKVPLRRLDTILFQCPGCLKKVKVLVMELPYDGYYPNDKARKTIEELLKPKVMNCSDKLRR